MTKIAHVPALLLLAACGSAGGDGAVSTSDDQALSAKSPTLVTIRADLRKCAAPLCGGYFARDVNKSTPEKYVSGLDTSALAPEAATQLDGAADGEAVLLARLGSKDPKSGTRALVVLDAWRGMPGVAVAGGDAYWEVDEWNAPGGTAYELNRAKSVDIAGVDVRGVSSKLSPGQQWMQDRIANADALVAGHMYEGDGDENEAGTNLGASQVFLHLPDPFLNP